jgi:ubiquinone/menaquinone biosynthesis C-methylase UbiE
VNVNSTLVEKQMIGSAAKGTAFDQIAAKYDQIFTHSHIGRAQRDAVWRVLGSTFKANDNILELNCGTGEDAVFLAKRGVTVFACDASMQMIARAEERLSNESTPLPIVFCHLPTERISELHPEVRFDGAFSNFSGLNCIQDLKAVAASLSGLVNSGDRLLLCFSTRFCFAEIVHYLIRGNFKKAFRRCAGSTMATLGEAKLPIYYPTLRQIRKYFAPHFVIRSYVGVGVAIPPSYCESWVRRHRGIFDVLCSLEKSLASIPLLRVTGDHVLISLEKVVDR